MQPRKENAHGGRTNPNLFAYLYTSRSPITTIYEVKPNLEGAISIATLKVLQDIKNADISLESMIMDDYKALEDFVALFIGLEFSRVCNNTDKDYIFTQYIAEFCKYNGFDALEFNSSLHKGGKNIAFFKPSLCEPVSSDKYEVNKIDLKFSKVQS